MKKKEILIHGLIWGLGYLFLATQIKTFGIFHRENGSLFLPLTLGTLINISIFYCNALYFLPNLLKKKGIRFYLPFFTVFFLILTLVETLIDYNWFVNYYSSEKESLTSQLFLNTFLNALFWISSSTYWFIKDWYQGEKMKRILIEEKLTTQMAFLKSQINPHFLFNTLNSIYAQCLKHEVPEISRSIALLSKMMRYMVYETGADRVPLSQEIEHLKNFIEVYKLRLTNEDKLMIEFTQNGPAEQVQIMPLLLLPFVENCFKHGFQIEGTSTIRMDLNIDKDGLLFQTENTIYSQPVLLPEYHSGFGLSNLKKRLEIHYPDTHKLETRIENNKFIAKLQLNLESTK